MINHTVMLMSHKVYAAQIMLKHFFINVEQ